MRKKFKKIVCIVCTLSMIGSSPISTFAADLPTQGNTTTSYTHGSDVTVTEDQLNTTIPSDYTVNTNTQGDAKSGTYQKLFDTENVTDVNINVDTNNWNYMLQNAIDKPTVLANSISIGSDTVSYVGLKTKGNLTLSSVWQSSSDRFSFGLNIGKYIKKSNGYTANQNFYGLEEFSLNNIYGDASYMKEYLSYEMMTKMGIPTPYYCLVKLSVNGSYWGIYSMVENVDKSLMKRSIDTSANGDLYKCESPGGDLIYSSSLDEYVNGTKTYDLTTTTDSSNILSKYTGILDNKEFGTCLEDYTDELSTATETTLAEDKATLTTQFNNLFTWMKTLNSLSAVTDANTDTYKTSLESILDVDEALKYFATNTYLVDLDSYQSEKQQNYCIYLLNGKVTIIPWDYNYSFGGYGVSDASAMINFNIDTPVIDVTLAERPLLNALLKNSEYRAKYEEYLKQCCTYAASITDEITAYKTKLAAPLQETSIETPFYTYTQFLTACDNLSPLNEKRILAVTNQVNDVFTTVSADSINLNAIGNVVGGGAGGGGNAPTNPMGTPGPNGPTGPAPSNGTPGMTSFLLSTSQYTFSKPSETLQLQTTVTGAAFSTSDASVATVDSNGLVTSVNNGSATITASLSTGQTAACNVTVAIKAQSVSLNQTTAAINTGDTLQLTATVLPALTQNSTVKWDTSNSSVATVSTDGNVTSLSAGTTVITCTTTDGTSLQTSCVITVTSDEDNSSTTQTVTVRKAKIMSIKRASKKIMLKLKKISDVNGYEIYRSTKKNGAYKKIKTLTSAKTTTFTNSSLKSGKVYYYKVRAYKKVNGSKVYGDYSGIVKVKVK